MKLQLINLMSVIVTLFLNSINESFSYKLINWQLENSVSIDSIFKTNYDL